MSPSGILVAVRPRQWTKNLLVLAAPAAAGVLLQPAVLLSTSLALVAFCLAASGTYLVNDTLDVASDRTHPVKSRRPIAAGRVSARAAVAVAVGCLLVAVVVALAVSWSLALVVVVYELVQLGYCLGLKHEAVIELGLVASGFVLRAVAGGVASQLPLSDWFLMTAGAGSLFMVAGKRYAEALLMEASGVVSRRVLSFYTTSFLRFVWTVAAGIVITTYSLWAFSVQQDRTDPWGLISTVPFVLALLRYALRIDTGDAGEPEQIVLTDRVLLGLGLVWALAFMTSVYT